MAEAEAEKTEKAKKPKKTAKAYKPGRACPKCSSRMAEHSDRFTCGRCGYTEWKKREKES